MNLLVINIGKLYGAAVRKQALRGDAMKQAPYLENVFLAAVDGIVEFIGPMSECPTRDGFKHVIDARGGIVTPAFCDSHTHIVWAGDRSGEFVDKINGLTYEEIAARGGGILNSADLLADTSVDDLFNQAAARMMDMISHGTGAVEIKTGYGLTTDAELKMIEVIERLRNAFPEVVIRSTFLGAHAVGRKFQGRQGEYVDYVINDMLPRMAAKADYIDVFCDRGFFTPEETDRILTAGKYYGLKPKIHANELANSGGLEVGIAHKAISVDHLEQIGEPEMELLKHSDPSATMLPGASFFSNLPYAPARQAIDKGCAVALASDFNPGSSPSGSMEMIWSLGCLKMRLTPAEALNAITVNGAAAMEVSDQMGSLAPGSRASMLVFRPGIKSLDMIPYLYTMRRMDYIILSGKVRCNVDSMEVLSTLFE